MQLSNSLINDFSKALDDRIKLKGLLELIDGLVIKAALKLMRKSFWDKLNEDAQRLIIALMEAFVSGDYSALPALTAAELNAKIDIPRISEGTEGKLMGAILEAAFEIALDHKKAA
ncbi:hypothetical protein [Roseivirga sp. UBA838]|uniref:hypothetical protein n=1 Tax=Roseivirga sp. UBA838 TaxID=1947393 RepID=UPI00257A5D59|nr:hypothetical protein [Roseivirga sp. UBA838]|tara:strand:+ start:19701 stop:20048 length:348 start_codon:yes stop_codon:yes gene_type:complete